MNTCIFVSDLHGHEDRYEKLFRLIREEQPAFVFMGGDLLPTGSRFRRKIAISHRDFINDFLKLELNKIRQTLGDAYPKIFLILGNDDPRFEEPAIISAGKNGLWEYVHNRQLPCGDYLIIGYAFVPPTPFQLKDWERYDVSRFVDPGCVSPEEGFYTVPRPQEEKKYATIEKDLEILTKGVDLKKAVMLFHTPPYRTVLDRAALDKKKVDHAPLDVHIGSIAVKRFIENRQPYVTLHGHVHESTKITGKWKERIGRTLCFSAAHHGPELALVRFDLKNPGDAQRELL